MTVVSMSRDELDRVQVLRDVVLERIAVAEAAQLLRLTRRHVFRLLRRYHERGASGLVSQKRGKPSNRSYPAVVRTQALALIRANYPDFGPTTGGNGMTQFGRALDQLNIDIICANVPQAKGRVERANGTLQDRLVKELRLAGISSIEAGNAFLPAFMENFNRRFAKAPFNDKDLHRRLSGEDDIDEAFARQEERTVSQSLTLQYDKMLFILEPAPVTRPLARQRVTIFNYPDGRYAIRHQGLALPHRVFDKKQRVTHTAIVENKRLSEALAWVKARQDEIRPVRTKTNSQAGGYIPRPKGRRGPTSFSGRHAAAEKASRTASAGAAAKHGLSAAPAETP